jgi:hypothetical protein
LRAPIKNILPDFFDFSRNLNLLNASLYELIQELPIIPDIDQHGSRGIPQPLLHSNYQNWIRYNEPNGR